MKKSYLKGKTAVITGASSGIGRSTSIALAKAGTNLILVSRNISKLKNVEQETQSFGSQVHACCGDISNKKDVQNIISQAIREFGDIDILVCNAGLYFRKSAVGQTIDDVRNIMEVNFFGSLNCIYETLPHFIKKKQGHIIVISSVDGKKGLPLDSAYVSSKFALAGFTEVLRQELHNSGIHVCTVFPGRIDTPMISKIKTPNISPKIHPEKVAQAIITSIIKKKKEVIIPYWTGKFLIVSNSISCGFGDWGVRIFKLEGEDIGS